LVLCAAYSPDGSRIVTGSNDFMARIWDARGGAALTVLRGHTRSIPSAHYSPDGTRIVTGSNDSTARIWDARTGAQLSVLAGHSDRVHSAAYSTDGTRIVTASFDKTARIWDARTGAQLGILAGHGDIVRSAAYSPDGTQIVTASDDKTARIWDARTGVQLRVLAGHRDSVIFAAYSPDGSYIVTASSDHTARIWAARESARLEDQILWDSSAQTDPLSEVDRAELGLPRDSRARAWPTQGSACDRAAASVYDPDRLTPGVLMENVNGDIAYSACSAEIGKPRHAARADYQMGRTLVARGDANAGQQQFEMAARRGYRAARVDLADLLSDASAGKPDPGRAASLYEQAWDGGVLIAAFKLGRLFENRVQSANAARAFDTDTPKAWLWYQKGADVGEPNALARFAERNENDALTAADPSKRNAQLLQAFEFYAAAVESAHDEDWPDDAWRHWQYRRASLARLLALEGMMQQVADAYAAVLDQRSARPTRP
jgi:TPR repeat protein